jgi:hypothetical protein
MFMSRQYYATLVAVSILLGTGSWMADASDVRAAPVCCDGDPNEIGMTGVPPDKNAVTPVPESVRAALGLAPFYQKCLDVGGLPVIGSANVSDFALREAAWIIRRMLDGREDILHALIANRVRVAVMAWNEFTTDIPSTATWSPRPIGTVGPAAWGPPDAPRR